MTLESSRYFFPNPTLWKRNDLDDQYHDLFSQVYIIFKELSILDESIISLRSSKNLDSDKMLQNSL